MVRLLNDGFCGAHGVVYYKVRQVGVFQRHRTHEQRFFLGPNAKGHPAVVFYGYSRHTRDFSMYAFKLYIEIRKNFNTRLCCR